jgi:hypothetical protein
MAERELGWDDTIEKDGGEFIVLPAGEYDFTVTKFERSRYGGGAKVPACNQAKLTITIHSKEYGDVDVFHNILLFSRLEGLISNFFTGIGLKKKGEKLRMNWSTVVGSTGRCKLEIHKYTKQDGTEGSNNQVKTFIPADEVKPQTQQQGQYQAPFPTGQQQGSNFTPGQF